ncbi:phosphatidylcholine transfer protein isoform X1 [Zootoca vivipara]|uniref:phosphatidylcholine transfer protein isoform X1 n=1 Tax=Zootoca vivipara TaxID=8524 RepID=UPI00293BEB66|nr:phosphatidylcholine transfer protein isoform X1 [Zootoca vivipara]
MSRGASAGPSSSSSSSSSSSTCCSSRKAEQARGHFGEEQFLAVCRESAKPREAARAAWELMAETASFCIFRLFDEKSGLYEYKVYATLGDCSPDVCAEVYMDLTYRTKWDRYLRVFMSYFDDPGGKVPSWLVNWGTKTGVPNFLIDMEKACHSYRKR